MGHEPTTLPADEALFVGTLDQRRAALDELIGRFSARLFALARHMVRSEELAEELVQETFVRLWQRAVQPPPGGRAIENLYAYLRRVLVNLTLHQYRPDAAAGGDADEADPLAGQPDDGPSPEQRVIAIESADRCLAALDRLPPEQRMVLALRVLEGRGYQELADELGWPIGTVMSRLHRARQAVAAMVDPEQAGQDRTARPARRSG